MTDAVHTERVLKVEGILPVVESRALIHQIQIIFEHLLASAASTNVEHRPCLAAIPSSEKGLDVTGILRRDLID